MESSPAEGGDAVDMRRDAHTGPSNLASAPVTNKFVKRVPPRDVHAANLLCEQRFLRVIFSLEHSRRKRKALSRCRRALVSPSHLQMNLPLDSFSRGIFMPGIHWLAGVYLRRIHQNHAGM